MLLAADPHESIDIDKLVGWLLAQIEETTGTPDSFFIVDVNDYEVFLQEHMTNAYHYDRIMLARLCYETPVLARARVENHMLVIYGRESERVSNVLFQRGFKTVHLRGNTAQFKEQYPCLFEPSIDFLKLREIYDQKRNHVYGGRLWRSTSASRLKTVSRNERAEKSKRMVSARPKMNPGILKSINGMRAVTRSDVVLKMEVDLSMPKMRSEIIRFEDTNWQMELVYTGPENNLALIIICENYDFSKSYNALVCLKINFARGRQVFRIFDNEFTVQENNICVQNMPTIQTLGGKNARFDIHLSLGLKKILNQKKEIAVPMIDFENENGSNFWDVVLKFPNDRKLYANRAYLSFHSTYFQVMFNSDFMERDAREIEFFEEFEEFLPALQIIHGVPLEINQENVVFLMTIADKYDFKILMEQCREAVQKMETIQFDTALVLTDLYGVDGVINRLMEKFDSVEEIRDFQNTSNYSNLKEQTKLLIRHRKVALSRMEEEEEEEEEEPKRNGIWKIWADKLDKHILSKF
ncbi:unnamed protein product [Caenorhabditis angaria]|uniref:BTB domain-containing protein n=1 Tax=Caenorhabditis angaria TaxID=860376 RepID=A0A9P1IMG1_9PELO|nr:unnamed protein product [Caenorhabditis angaria]